MNAAGLLTSAQAAARLGKSLKAFSNFRERRRELGQPIPEYRMAGSDLLWYRPADLDALYQLVSRPSTLRAVSRAFLKSHRRSA